MILEIDAVELFLTNLVRDIHYSIVDVDWVDSRPN